MWKIRWHWGEKISGRSDLLETKNSSSKDILLLFLGKDMSITSSPLYKSFVFPRNFPTYNIVDYRPTTLPLRTLLYLKGPYIYLFMLSDTNTLDDDTETIQYLNLI